jgi:uncharacterized protein with ParB-like and HNH nuclease domain
MSRLTFNQPKLKDTYTGMCMFIFEGATTRVFNDIKNNNIKIDLDIYLPSIGKNLQRGDVWTILQKKELIRSILRGVQIPAFIILQIIPRKLSGQTIYKIIDGKQRLSAIIGFIKNEFSIAANNGTELFFDDLTDDEKFEFKSGLGSLRANGAIYGEEEELSDNLLIEWFKFVNFAGTPQDVEHLNNLK